MLLSVLSCKTQTCDFEQDKKYNKKDVVLIQPEDDHNYKKISDIEVPENFERIETESNSFGNYLQNLPLKEDNTVYYYNGEPKHTQDLHFAVIDIDVGTHDLQQCADACMRLWAEYLYSQKRYSEIHFNFLSDGKPRYFLNYSGNDTSSKVFRKYMNYIFSYANTSSLYDELKPVDFDEIQIGDIFIQKGSPYGHSIMVMDMAVNKSTGEKIFMISQSFMPAQSIHIMKNLNNKKISPWYSTNFKEYLYTPEWTFSKEDLRRF